ncbi:MAG: hypothetical protein ABIA04_06675 [Pseudomonadota bacterium]
MNSFLNKFKPSFFILCPLLMLSFMLYAEPNDSCIEAALASNVFSVNKYQHYSMKWDLLYSEESPLNELSTGCAKDVELFLLEQDLAYHEKRSNWCKDNYKTALSSEKFNKAMQSLSGLRSNLAYREEATKRVITDFQKTQAKATQRVVESMVSLKLLILEEILDLQLYYKLRKEKVVKITLEQPEIAGLSYLVIELKYVKNPNNGKAVMVKFGSIEFKLGIVRLGNKIILVDESTDYYKGCWYAHDGKKYLERKLETIEKRYEAMIDGDPDTVPVEIGIVEDHNLEEALKEPARAEDPAPKEEKQEEPVQLPAEPEATDNDALAEFKALDFEQLLDVADQYDYSDNEIQQALYAKIDHKLNEEVAGEYMVEKEASATERAFLECVQTAVWKKDNSNAVLCIKAFQSVTLNKSSVRSLLALCSDDGKAYVKDEHCIAEHFRFYSKDPASAADYSSLLIMGDEYYYQSQTYKGLYAINPTYAHEYYQSLTQLHEYMIIAYEDYLELYNNRAYYGPDNAETFLTLANMAVWVNEPENFPADKFEHLLLAFNSNTSTGSLRSATGADLIRIEYIDKVRPFKPAITADKVTGESELTVINVVMDKKVNDMLTDDSSSAYIKFLSALKKALGKA